MCSSVEEVSCVLIWNDTFMTLQIVDSSTEFETFKNHYPVFQTCMCIYWVIILRQTLMKYEYEGTELKTIVNLKCMLKF
jgi:hypothetical protein